MCKMNHRLRERSGMDRPIATQPSNQDQWHQWSSHHRDALAESEFCALAEQQRWPENLYRAIRESANVCFRLSLDAAVKDAGFGIGADCADEEKLRSAAAQSSLRECDDVVVIDAPERCLRSCLLDCRAEATEHVIDMREI